MAQSLELNIKTTSDVPQAMEKAKTATVSFSKQVEDIQKKFSTAFKDIALGFLAPMVVLNSVINAIQASFEKNRQNMAEAMRFAELGESKFISAEARYLAAEKKRREAEGTTSKAKMGEEELIKDFLKNDPRTAEIFKTLSQATIYGLGQAELRGTVTPGTSGEEQMLAYAVKNLEVRKAVLDIIKKDMGISPTGTQKDFKGPEGFSNVIGVGPNPVLEAMAQQTEIALAQLAELQKISGSTQVGPGDFTKGNQSK